MGLELARIEDKIDRVAAGGTEIAMGFGGVKFATLLELMEFAKLMAVSGSAVPVHLRGNPGTCLAICTRALRFGFDPFSLAEHSYTMSKSMKVNGQWEDVETIAYDSFVIHAIIEAHGNVTGKLKPTYIGEGDDMKCICTGVVNGETLTVETETVGKIKTRIGRNEKGKLKGSPLWETKPKQQLWYDARRDWCRAHQPHILLGWYDKDELIEHGSERAKDVTKPDVASRLKGNKGRGFNHGHVERESRGGVIEESQANADVETAAGRTSEAVAESASRPVDGRSSTATSEIMDATAGETAPDSNSSDVAPIHTQAKPAEENAAPNAPPSSAGNDPETSVQTSPGTDTGDGAGSDHQSAPSLPQGWEITYAAALRRAQKVQSLDKLAAQWWAQYDGWEKHKTGPHAATAAAIYNAFKSNFGNKDAIDLELREIF